MKTYRLFVTTVEIISLKQKVIICPWFSGFCRARRAGLSLLLWAFAGFRFGLLLLSASAQEAIQQPSVAPPTLLVAIDHRPTISLNGDWHTIADPYGTGLYTFHGKLRTDGYFMNGYQAPGGEPLDYDFQKSPILHVPRDWNTQRESLFFYEGPMWYEKDFSYQRKPGTRVFFHVGAANYRSYVWVNGQKVCEHEGGFTPFDCEVTGRLKDGGNFIVMAVDNTRLADGIPTLQTDWFIRIASVAVTNVTRT
jgi:beta-glucuronidase